MKEEKEKPKRSLRRKIFNGVIGFFAGLIVVFLLLVGFSQTYTFREILRNKIINIFNSSTGGRLYIGKIEGTLFTTLTVSDISITIDNDTLIASKKIKVFVSPLQIFLNKLYVRDFQAEDLYFALRQDSNKAWNISKLSTDKDTSKSESIIDAFQVNNIDIKNLRFVRKTYEYHSVDTQYDIINFDDLDVRRINISGYAYGNIKENDYALKLNNFSLRPNLKKFTIKKFSGEFFANTKSASVRNFRIETDSSDINLTARLDSINLFAGITLEDFKNYPAQIQLDVKSFWFDDLSSFIEATDILKGRPSLKLVADGKFGAINIRQLKLKYLNSSLDIKGSLTKLNTPSHMYIDAVIQKGRLNYSDVLSLLPKLQLPVFENLVLDNTDIKFKGEPTKFTSKLTADVGQGKLSAEAFLNVQTEQIEYNARIETEKLDLKPIWGMNSEINSLTTLKGKGFSPGNLEAQLSSQVANSKIENNVVHDFKIGITGSAGKIIVDFNTAINNLKGSISGSLDFTDGGIPKYNFAGKINSLNLYQFTADSTLNSNLNFGIFAQGDGFKLDSLTTDITVNMDASSFNDKNIPASRLRLLVNTEQETKRIDLISPFVDFTFTGKFSLAKADSLIEYQFGAINSAVSRKISELNPLNVVQDSEISISEENTIPPIVNYDLNVDYKFAFKDLQPFSDLIKASRLDITGKGSGAIKNDSDNFSISAKIYLDNFVKVDSAHSPIYISDLSGDFKFSRNNHTLSFDDLFGIVSITADRFYINQDIRELEADLTFNQSKLFFNTSASINSLWNAEFEGNASFSPQMQEIIFERAALSKGGVEWKNREPFYLSFASDHFQLNGFILENKSSLISASAQLFNVGNLNGNVELKNISIEDLNRMFPEAGNSFSGFLNADGKIQGTLSDPLINASVIVKELGIKDKRAGDLICTLEYKNKDITTELLLLDSLAVKQNPILSLKGNIPIDLNLKNSTGAAAPDKQIALHLISSRFNINNFGDMLPLVVNQEGVLESDITISGTLNEPNYQGNFRVKKGKFTGRINNLNYDFGLKLNLDKRIVKVDSMAVKNSADSRYIGTLQGSGTIELAGLDIDKINLLLNGDIAIYGERTKSVTPSFYGDLFVASSGNWQFEYNKGKSFFTGKVLLKETNLTYTTGQDIAATGSSERVKIIYLADSKKVNDKEVEFNKIIQAQKPKDENKPKETGQLGYNISVETVNAANIMFVFSNLANRVLTVHATTNNLYFKSDTGPQGRLELLSGSNLNFINKRFDATGSVFFEKEIANPNLDITAAYQSEYAPASESDKTYTYEVLMKLKGTLDQLALNLSKEKDKFEIWNVEGIQGRQQIFRKDDNDVLSFILTGKFKDDLTQGEKSTLASTLSSSVATSLLGSFLTGFLNSQLGDFVRGVDINSEGFAIEGSLFKNLKFEVGGNSQILQDFNNMSLKLEYPILSNLSARYERKDPILKSTIFDKKIHELALKLRFIF